MNETMTAKDFPTIPEGTVISSGTLRPQALLQAVAWALDGTLRTVETHAAIRGVLPPDVIKQHRALLTEAFLALDLYRHLLLGTALVHSVVDETRLAEWTDETIDALCTALEDFIPAGCYVDMHEGDGALLGVWRAED